ncbi:MAG: winged helix-turn-helix domain-containing protein, partial [Proteobacteria bacterium]|nr:winged helix-turn-helix domain-containing protein [Pseudomonadota bacterium]
MNGPVADQPDEEPARLIELAAVAPFRLGPLEFRPATRQARGPSGPAHLIEPRVMQVLVALHQARGAVVSRDSLVARCWGLRIVGDDAINRAVAKARQVADLATPAAFVIETVPRVGYRLLEAGVSKAVAAPRSVAAEPGARAPGPPRIGRRELIAGGAVVVITGAAAYAGVRLWPRRGPADPLVAVLPFDNLSPDPQLGYFADGLSEDILNALTRSGEMRVTSRASSFTFRGPQKAKAAEALKADYLLDGSVLRAGGRLRVNVQLTEVANHETLWSDSFDRDLADGLQIEDEIAGRVAQALKIRFEIQPKVSHLDPEAFDLYLRGREATGQHNAEALRGGAELLRQAVAKAPDFAPAWFELARNDWRSGFLSPLSDQVRDYQEGLDAAERTLNLDPKNGAAYGLIVQMKPFFGHWREIDAGLAKGLKLSPNDPNLLTWQCNFLSLCGRPRAALTFGRRALALDPFDIFPSSKLSQTLAATGQYAEAE